MSNKDMPVAKFGFGHLKIGDSVLITESVKLALEQYECATTEPTIQGIIAKQAAAANVLGVIWRETRIAEAALAELEGGDEN